MIKVIIEDKGKPTDLLLKITSSTLEEKVFLTGLYDRRVPSVKLTDNPDGTVTLELTY